MNRHTQDYKGTWTLVTGAGKLGRIGAAIALHMAHRGSDIFLHYRSDRAAADAVKKQIEETARVRVELVTGELSKKEDVAASFQQAVIDVLTRKTMRAAKEFGARSIILCGGVAANKLLRKTLAMSAKRYAIRFFVPPNDLNGDNAAMIGITAYINHLRKKKYNLTAQANLTL